MPAEKYAVYVANRSFQMSLISRLAMGIGVALSRAAKFLFRLVDGGVCV
jgi:hypothetical protein